MEGRTANKDLSLLSLRDMRVGIYFDIGVLTNL